MGKKKADKDVDRHIIIDGRRYTLPHIHKERMFKLAYQIDFEEIHEWLYEADDEFLPASSELSIIPNIAIRKVADHRSGLCREGINGDIDHVNQHLPAIMEDIIKWLFFVEGSYSQAWTGSLRNRYIDNFKQFMGTAMRRRLPAKSGAPVKSDRQDTLEETEEFRRLFIEAVTLLVSKKKPLTQNSIAKLMALRIRNEGLAESPSSYHVRWAKWSDERLTGYRDRGKKMSSAALRLGISYDILLAEAKLIQKN